MRLAVLLSLLLASPAIVADECRVRVASFNVALNFPESGGLAAALATGDHGPARKLAAIIQTVRPDVLLLNEVDHDPDMAGLTLLRDRFLAVGSDDRDGMRYEHTFTAPVNTGVPSGADLDRNGSIGGPGDAFGFGAFPGQYGMAVLSRLPIDVGGARTFQELPWSALPAPAWPIDPETGESWYDDDAKRVLRLSSKSHWDIPVELPGGATLHLLASHPTPPVFDGPEDRNGLRNADEIRFWRYYIDGEPFRDDQ
ncbi:MAG: endonuclease/exonuclease/phosphatase family protein, partial [Pseudomonadota bacterium]